MGGFYPPRGRILMCLKIILFLLCLMSYVKSFSMGKLASPVCRASRKSQSLPIYFPQTNNLSVWGVMMTKSQIWQFAQMRTWASWSCDRHGAPCLLTAMPIHTLPHGPFICLPGFKFRRQRVPQHLRSLSFTVAFLYFRVLPQGHRYDESCVYMVSFLRACGALLPGLSQDSRRPEMLKSLASMN